MFAGTGGQGHVRVDRKTAKESKDLAQTNSQYLAAIEKLRAIRGQIATEAAKIQSLSRELKAGVSGPRSQALASDLAAANERLRILKDQLSRTQASLTIALQEQSIQVGSAWTVPGAVVVGVGAACCCTLLMILLSRLRVRRRLQAGVRLLGSGDRRHR